MGIDRKRALRELSGVLVMSYILKEGLYYSGASICQNTSESALKICAFNFMYILPLPNYE